MKRNYWDADENGGKAQYMESGDMSSNCDSVDWLAMWPWPDFSTISKPQWSHLQNVDENTSFPVWPYAQIIWQIVKHCELKSSEQI